MRWPDSAVPVRMQRVALVAPSAALRDVLVQVADAAAMQIDQDGRTRVSAAAAGQRAARRGGLRRR